MTRLVSASQLTASIFFDGLMLMCINSSKNNRCEVGFIKCELHQPFLQVDPDPQGSPAMPITEDLYIKVVNPQSLGVTRHDAGDDKDFDLVLDLEGYKLHRDKVIVNTKKFVAKLAINAGELYAADIHTDLFKLVQWTAADPVGVVFGRFDPIQHGVGLDVFCQDVAGSGVAIINAA